MNHKKIVRVLLATQGGSLVGSRMTSIAIGIWLFQSTGRATYLLLIPFFNEIPTLIFGNLTGVILDKMHKKSALILGDFGQAIGSIVLLASIVTVGFIPVIFYLVVVVQGIFSSMQTVAADATTAILVEDEHLDKLNAYKEMLFPIASFLGPALTGALYPFVGLKGILVVDLSTFIFAVSIVGLMNFESIEKIVSDDIASATDPHEVKSVESFFESLKSGYRYLVSHKGLLYLVIYIGIVNIMLNGPLELIIPYALSLSGDERFVSMLMSLMGVATFLGSFLLSIGTHKGKRAKRIMFLSIITGMMMILFGISRSKLTLMGTLFLVMLPLPMVNALFKSILQNYVPLKMQGRVFSIAYQIAYGIAPISFLIVGPLVDKWLEPLMTNRSISWLDSIFGHQAGAGMGLILSVSGAIIILASVVGTGVKKITSLENTPQ